MRVLTIFVRHGTEQYSRAEQDLADLFRAQLPGVKRDTVVVDTALPRSHSDTRSGRVVIGGDNSSWEFSGFDSGLSYIGDRISNYDLVNLTTSAFRQLYTGYLDRFRNHVLESIVGTSVCLGHIDCYNESIEVVGCHSQHWVRSSCLFISPAELKTLRTLVSIRNGHEWFSGNPAAPFRSDAPLSDTYRQFITDWLTGDEIGQGTTWHSRIPLNEKNLHRFEQKATAILNEHILALRLRAAGCRTIDVTWLWGVLAGQRRATVDWDTPWWRQLAERDRDAIKV